MRTFFLDLASHDGLLACIDDQRVVASATVDHRIRDDELMPIYEKVLKDAHWKEIDIERLAAVTGPGGFTSLRVAAAFANALAFALDVPATGIHLSDVYAKRATGDFLWLHSTKKTQLFVRGFGKLEKEFPEPTLWNVNELLVALPQNILWVGELIPEQETELLNSGATRKELTALEAVLPAFIDSLTYEKETIEPWYGRTW